MSTAYYPQGMRTMPASGYNHNSSNNCKQYIPWKGTGLNSFPVGTAPGHIRPLTNNDPGNVFQTGFGLARPIKHYRKGRVIPVDPITANNLIGKDPHNQLYNVNIDEAGLINYNMNRFVSSSKGSSLGGGAGGRGLLNEMLDNPGSFIVKQNTLDSTGNFVDIQKECKTCEGVAIVASYKPNLSNLEETPEPNSQSPVFCCNDEYKAKRRVIYASTNLKKNYYTTHKQYLQNICKTYDQKVFNFQQPRPVELTNALLQSGVTTSQLAAAKPGSALATSNTYIANCFPNAEIYDATEDALVNKLLTILLNMGIIDETQVQAFLESNVPNFDELFNWLNALPESDKERALLEFQAFINNPYWGVPFAGPSNPNGCKLTVYKPNNPQYAVQGAVDSSTRMLKLNVDTITTNSASIHNRNSYVNYAKNKVPGCNTPTVFQFQNKKSCYYKSLPQYQVPVSQPSPYRYFPGVTTSSNHFSQSPNTYNTTTGTGAYR